MNATLAMRMTVNDLNVQRASGRDPAEHGGLNTQCGCCIKKASRITAILLALVAAGIWLGTGANRGWTKTSVQKTTVDAVTGIEGITYERRFIPGLDFLGVTFLGASLLAGASFFLGRKHSTN